MHSRNHQSEKTPRGALPELRRQVSQLLEEFLTEPNGPAREILELYLVTHLASQQSRYEERALGEASESRRKAEAVRQEADGLRRERLSLAEDNRRLAAEVAQAQVARRRLHDEFRVIKADAQAKEVTQADIVRRISAAIGMGSGLTERIEPGCEESNG